jgi:hypothetical protein
MASSTTPACATTVAAAKTVLDPTILSLANAERFESEAHLLMFKMMYSLALRQWEKVLSIQLSLQGFNHFRTMTVFEAIGLCFYKTGNQRLANASWHVRNRSWKNSDEGQQKWFRERYVWTAHDWKYYDRHAPIALSHERSGDEYRRLGDYSRARIEYSRALHIEATFKFHNDKPVVAHLYRKIACLGLDKATTVARQASGEHNNNNNNNVDFDTKSSDLWNKDWLQDCSKNGLLDAKVCQAIVLGDKKFAQLKWHAATFAYLRAIEIENVLLKPPGSCNDHALNRGTVGAVTRVLLSEATRTTQFGTEPAPVPNNHDHHAPSSAACVVPSAPSRDSQTGSDPSPCWNDHDNALSGMVGAVPIVLTSYNQTEDNRADGWNDQDHTPSSANGAVPSVLLSDTQIEDDQAPDWNDHDHHAPSSTSGVVTSLCLNESMLPVPYNNGQEKEELQQMMATIKHFQRLYVLLQWLLVLLVLLSVVLTWAHWSGRFESNQEAVNRVLQEPMRDPEVSYPFFRVLSNKEKACTNEMGVFDRDVEGLDATTGDLAYASGNARALVLDIARCMFWTILGVVIGLCVTIPRKFGTPPESERDGGCWEDLLSEPI